MPPSVCGVSHLSCPAAGLGFFAGFWLEAHSITLLLGEGFLATTTGWIVGFVVGILLALFSYLFYALAVAIIAVLPAMRWAPASCPQSASRQTGC